MQSRQLLLWAIATRRQLGRWEPLVAANIRALYMGRPPFPDNLIWQAEIDHHFLLIAARNLIRAIELADFEITIEPTVRAELIEGRDLLEHWDENAPIFNVLPRQEQPKHRSGQAFAERNPRRGPYWWLGWNSSDGPVVMPNVPARVVHDLVDRVEAAVTAKRPELRRFIPEWQPSPWLGEEHGRDRWWPRRDSEDSAH